MVRAWRRNAINSPITARQSASSGSSSSRAARTPTDDNHDPAAAPSRSAAALIAAISGSSNQHFTENVRAPTPTEDHGPDDASFIYDENIHEDTQVQPGQAVSR